MEAGEIEVKLLEYEGLSPIARIGIEEISRRGEIVSPERLRALLRQSTSARIMDTFLVAVCTNCWNYLELKKVGDLEGLVQCPSCGKEAIGLSTESYENVFSLAMKARSRTGLPRQEAEAHRVAEEVRRAEEGARARMDMLLAGRGIRLADAAANLAAKRKKKARTWWS